MFSLRKVLQIPLRNTCQILKQTRSYKSDNGVSRSIDRHGTTIIVVRKDGVTVMAGDGQVRFHIKYVQKYKDVYKDVCKYEGK